jgi:hydroxymethylpyrimidine/phosphomethylpyrimidine kinase
VLPTALTIAGLDPSGGAGLAADLRAFAVAGAWGTAVCACLTVQSRRGVRAVEPVATALVLAQAEELLADLPVRALKTGALGSADNARAVTALLARRPSLPAVVDPVMIPTRVSADGVRLDGDGALAAMRALAAACTLVTPNRDEAAALLGAPIASEADAPEAGRALVALGARAALVKGGHGAGPEAVDWLVTRRAVHRLARPRIPAASARFHGTGCALASLVAGRLAVRERRGRPTDADLLAAVRWARARLDAALRSPHVLGPRMRVPRLAP